MKRGDWRWVINDESDRSKGWRKAGKRTAAEARQNTGKATSRGAKAKRKGYLTNCISSTELICWANKVSDRAGANRGGKQVPNRGASEE